MSPDEYARTVARLRKRRRLEHARGLRGPNQPAEPLRDLLRMYVLEGWTPVIIGESVGLTGRTIELILSGTPQSVRWSTHNALGGLSRRRMLEVARPEAYVPNTGTWRRLRALQVMGWDWESLRENGGARFHSRCSVPGQQIKAETYRRAIRLYDERWNRTGPSIITRRRAIARGWLPPQAWDDDIIDDPSAVPVVGERPRAIDALIEDVTDLLAAGETAEGIAWRLGRRVESIERQMYRAGRADLVRALRGEVAS